MGSDWYIGLILALVGNFSSVMGLSAQRWSQVRRCHRVWCLFRVFIFSLLSPTRFGMAGAQMALRNAIAGAVPSFFGVPLFVSSSHPPLSLCVHPCAHFLVNEPAPLLMCPAFHRATRALFAPPPLPHQFAGQEPRETRGGTEEGGPSANQHAWDCADGRGRNPRLDCLWLCSPGAFLSSLFGVTGSALGRRVPWVCGCSIGGSGRMNFLLFWCHLRTSVSPCRSSTPPHPTSRAVISGTVGSGDTGHERHLGALHLEGEADQVGSGGYRPRLWRRPHRDSVCLAGGPLLRVTHSFAAVFWKFGMWV